jgi:branched-chain amino acid transport system ATP-binding protein
MFEVAGIEAGYGEAQVLFGVDLHVNAGEAIAMLGRNGMGKTTAVRAMFGLLAVRAGRVRFEGQDITGRPPFVIAQRGLGLVPEGRLVFPTLTVEENLVATAATRFGPSKWTLAQVYELFPLLAERRGNLGSQLSGGEQQMLAIGRALMSRPQLLLLDEPSLGLAPLLVSAIFDTIRQLKREGATILLVEQNARLALDIADRAYVMETGRVTLQGPAMELKHNPQVEHTYLGT